MNSADPKPVMVVSHERSGTHFLMNTLAAEFGYVSRPYVNFDNIPVNINFYHPDSILSFFRETRGNKINTIRKSHHQVSFFDFNISDILENVRIFYIYRDPRDMCHSFRHFLNSWAWFEGPKVGSASTFIRTAPAGQMLRYQYHQLPDMLDRWRVHVEGWIDAAARHRGIITIRYEDLDQRYDEVIHEIASRMGWKPGAGNRPDIDEKTILRSKRSSKTNVYTDADLDYFRVRIGPTMRRLGYEI